MQQQSNSNAKGKSIYNYDPSKYYSFSPTDAEAIDYLEKKLMNEYIPDWLIKDVDVYKFNPNDLAAEKFGEVGSFYCFTPRQRKYPNGIRPNRAAGDGHWKATGGDKEVFYEDGLIGYRKSLVFIMQAGEIKTNWLMHEYLIPQQTEKYRNDHYINQLPSAASTSSNSNSSNDNDMMLDKWVLCRIYYNRPGKRNVAGEDSPSAVVLPNNQNLQQQQQENNNILSISSVELANYNSGNSGSSTMNHDYVPAAADHLITQNNSLMDIHGHDQDQFMINNNIIDQYQPTAQDQIMMMMHPDAAEFNQLAAGLTTSCVNYPHDDQAWDYNGTDHQLKRARHDDRYNINDPQPLIWMPSNNYPDIQHEINGVVDVHAAANLMMFNNNNDNNINYYPIPTNINHAATATNNPFHQAQQQQQQADHDDLVPITEDTEDTEELSEEDCVFLEEIFNVDYNPPINDIGTNPNTN